MSSESITEKPNFETTPASYIVNKFVAIVQSLDQRLFPSIPDDIDPEILGTRVSHDTFVNGFTYTRLPKDHKLIQDQSSS